MMLQLRRQQYKDFIDKYNLHGKRVLEVGCGQGEFLQVLAESDIQAYGIENSSELVKKATDKGLHVVQGFFGKAGDHIFGGGYADAFVSINFLEHQPNPCGMLRGIYNNLTSDGVGIVTVPSFEYIIECNSYYEFIRDHLAYYTEESLSFLLDKTGFAVHEMGRFNCDTIYAYVQKKQPIDITALKSNFLELGASLRKYIEDIRTQGGSVAMWGASHQGFTILSTAQLEVEYILDSAPFKHGKYSPATHVPIVPPEHFHLHPVSAIIIVAPGYTEEIYRTIRTKYGIDVQVVALRSENLEILRED